MQPDVQRGFRLHDRTVLPEQNRITGDGEDAHVAPRTMAVLVCLAEHAGEVVTRQFLDDHVWHGSVVTDHALTGCISELRNYLGDARGESRFIETIPKRGYRLIAPVTPLESPAAPATLVQPVQPVERAEAPETPESVETAETAAHSTSRRALRVALPVGLAVVAVVIAAGWWAIHAGFSADKTAVVNASPPTAAPAARSARAAVPSAVTAAIPAKSIAVLPFVNESGDRDQQYFSDGLSDDLINALSQLDGLKVISRNSAFQFRNSQDSAAAIGKALDVAHLLEGSVQRAGDEVRITATLVNASDGSVLWSARYDKPYQDLFALQDAITQAVATALQAKLLLAPGAAVQSDRPPSGDLAAYAAYQHGVAYAAFGTEAGLHRAIAAYTEATRLDPAYAAAYARLGATLSRLADQFLSGTAAARTNADASAAVASALKLDPDSSLAHQAQSRLLSTVDFDWTGAASEARRALQLAPNDADAKVAMASSLASLGHVQRAVGLQRQAVDADPRRAGSYYQLGLDLAALGRPDAARQAFATAVALQPGATLYHWQLAVVAILRGDAAAARAAARQEPPGIVRDVAMAQVLAIGADRAAADAALAKVVANDAGSAAYQIAEVYALRHDPDNLFRWLDRAWRNRDSGISMLLYDPFILRYRYDSRFDAFCRKVGLPTTTDAVAMK